VTITIQERQHKRPKGVLGIGWAVIYCAVTGRTEHACTASLYPDHLVRRIRLQGGGGHGWTLSALAAPRETPAPWKFVVITGAPSWAEYWAPVLAGLPADREMIVVDRPGYAASQPQDAVLDIRIQAETLAPLLDGPPGQKVLLIGQSYGAPIAALMAQMRPDRVSSLVMLSSYLGEPGPTAKSLVDTGAHILMVLPRDLRNAVQEIVGQPAQLDQAKAALKALRVPIHLIHGDQDDFAPLEAAERLAAEMDTAVPIRFHRVEGANHFLTDGPVEALLAAIEACVPPEMAAPPRRRPRWRDLFAAVIRPARAAAVSIAAKEPRTRSPRAELALSARSAAVRLRRRPIRGS
jgi:pimeloyl-ACP methyl ester carboxylesterase